MSNIIIKNGVIYKNNLIRYDTGWVPKSVWTNQDIIVNHNFNTELYNLIVNVLVKDDNYGGVPILINNAMVSFSEGAGATSFGITIYQIDLNSIKIQTGLAGILFLRDSDGVLSNLTSAASYRITVEKI